MGNDKDRAETASTLWVPSRDEVTLVDPSPVKPSCAPATPKARAARPASGATGGGRAHWAPGDVLNERYEVQRLLGQGGMGVVYQVTDRLHPERPPGREAHRPRGGGGGAPVPGTVCKWPSAVSAPARRGWMKRWPASGSRRSDR